MGGTTAVAERAALNVFGSGGRYSPLCQRKETLNRPAIAYRDIPQTEEWRMITEEVLAAEIDRRFEEARQQAERHICAMSECGMTPLTIAIAGVITASLMVQIIAERDPTMRSDALEMLISMMRKMSTVKMHTEQ
jgi:hypothetical protein